MKTDINRKMSNIVEMTDRELELFKLMIYSARSDIDNYDGPDNPFSEFSVEIRVLYTKALCNELLKGN